MKDERKHIRELGLCRVLKDRQAQKEKKIRRIKIPTINFSAVDYIDLISIPECSITASPLLKHISNKDVRDMIVSRNHNNIEVLNCPFHTQSVKRTVKLVTEASATLCEPESRNSFIRLRLQSFVAVFSCNR
ncbi:unnamed protein product [Diabrotica balteata]|uniref:Uncharacterized protein n=1 Tax=Diabrotica balteata TaxID=107213 RepID=A0A9N9T737_DIABA|nr:unnamed protein product [Diabrotica balteata]